MGFGSMRFADRKRERPNDELHSPFVRRAENTLRIFFQLLQQELSITNQLQFALLSVGPLVLMLSADDEDGCCYRGLFFF